MARGDTATRACYGEQSHAEQREKGGGKEAGTDSHHNAKVRQWSSLMGRRWNGCAASNSELPNSNGS